MSTLRTDVTTRSSRVKLVQFTTLFAIGGTERHLVNLAQGLDPSRFELHFACLKRQGEFLSDIENLRAPVTEYGINSLYNRKAFQERLRFARYIRENHIQIVHTYNFYGNVFAIPAARLAGTPAIVASIRDTGAYLTSLQRRVQRLMCRAADRILVNAEAVRQWLIAERYPRQKIRVIPNGIDLARFGPRADGGHFRRELGLPPRAPLVAVLARLNPLKGVEDFLQAAPIIAGRFPQARFLIVGDGDSRRELEVSAARLGLHDRLVFTGFRADVPEVLSAVTVSVLPSLSEGFSNVVLESMAAGVPVVATTVGGNPEAVEDGVTGFLVPPRQPEALARAIGLLLENPQLAAQFGQAGRRRVTEHFSRDQMVRATERLYLDLLQGKYREPIGGATRAAYPTVS